MKKWLIYLIPQIIFAANINLTTSGEMILPVAQTINYGYIAINNPQAELLIPTSTTVNVYNSGWVNVFSGQLLVDGQLNTMTVNIGQGMLAGVGFVNAWGLTNNQAGVVQPGNFNQIGTLTLGGDYQQGLHATTTINISNMGNSQLNILGDAYLNGNLTVNFLNGFLPTANNSYVILSANTINGQFTNFNNYITPTLYFQADYSNQQISLTVNRNYLNPLLANQLNSHQLAIASTLNQINQANLLNSDFNQVLTSIDHTTTDNGVINAFNQLMPLDNNLLFKLTNDNLWQAEHLFLPNSCNNFTNCLMIVEKPFSIKFMLSNFNGTADNTLLNMEADTNGQTANLLFTAKANPYWSFGLLTEWQQAEASFAQSNLKTSGLLIGPTINLHDKQWDANALFAYADNEISSHRQISLMDLDRVAIANANTYTQTAYVNASYNLLSSEEFLAGPEIGMQYFNLHIPAYAEDGANSLDLTMLGDHQKSLQSQLGAFFETKLNLSQWQLSPNFSVNYLHQLLAVENQQSFYFSEINNSPTILTTNLDYKNAFLLGANLCITKDQLWAINIGYQALLTNQNHFNGITAEFNWHFS